MDAGLVWAALPAHPDRVKVGAAASAVAATDRLFPGDRRRPVRTSRADTCWMKFAKVAIPDLTAALHQRGFFARRDGLGWMRFAGELRLKAKNYRVRNGCIARA